MASLDFDGDYGRTYRSSIRHSVPGHDTLHEIALAAVATTSRDAQQALVVGPGPGDELPALLTACPRAAFTVMEPSDQMLTFCRQSVADHPAQHRCQWMQLGLSEACSTALKGTLFDLVVCHNVLHLFSADQQNAMLRQLATLTAKGGSLVLSAYSEPEEAIPCERLLAVGGQRLENRGLTKEQVNTLLASRNKVVFSVDSSRVSAVLGAEGLTPPLQLYQGLFAKLWLLEKA